MINSCLPFQIGIIGDSQLVKMGEFIDGDFNLYGKGGEKALNWQLYTNALVENDFIIVFWAEMISLVGFTKMLHHH